VALKPGDADAYARRAVARHNTGDLDGAVADFEQALALNPDDAHSAQQLDVARRKRRWKRILGPLLR